jgi:hypothetical protein
MGSGAKRQKVHTYDTSEGRFLYLRASNFECPHSYAKKREFKSSLLLTYAQVKTHTDDQTTCRVVNRCLVKPLTITGELPPTMIVYATDNIQVSQSALIPSAFHS